VKLSLHFLLRLCRNCFCTCGEAAQKDIFAAQPQDKDRTNMYLNTTLLKLALKVRANRDILKPQRCGFSAAEPRVQKQLRHRRSKKRSIITSRIHISKTILKRRCLNEWQTVVIIMLRFRLELVQSELCNRMNSLYPSVQNNIFRSQRRFQIENSLWFGPISEWWDGDITIRRIRCDRSTSERCRGSSVRRVISVRILVITFHLNESIVFGFKCINQIKLL
jgi:hypothetical protein